MLECTADSRVAVASAWLLAAASRCAWWAVLASTTDCMRLVVTPCVLLATCVGTCMVYWPIERMACIYIITWSVWVSGICSLEGVGAAEDAYPFVNGLAPLSLVNLKAVWDIRQWQFRLEAMSEKY